MIYVVSSIFALAAIIYMIYHIIALFSTEIKVEAARTVSYTETAELTGVVFRDEYILYSAQQGSVNHLCTDGARIAKNASVAEVYSGSLTGNNVELAAIDAQLEILRRGNLASGEDTRFIDVKINNLYGVIRQKSEQGDFEYASQKTTELLVLLNQREIITNRRLNFNVEIASLQARRDAIAASSGIVLETVNSPTSGYYSSNIDGYESKLTATAAEEADFDTLLALMNTKPSEVSSTGSGYAVGKIAVSPLWYLCVKMDKDAAVKLTEGKEYTVVFPFSSEKSIVFILEGILTSYDSETAVLKFSTRMLPEGFSFTRYQTVTIVTENITGLRVPEKAVHVENGITGVYILKNNMSTYREIDVLYTKDGYYIVRRLEPGDDGYDDSLHLYDSIIVEGKELAEEINIQKETTSGTPDTSDKTGKQT